MLNSLSLFTDFHQTEIDIWEDEDVDFVELEMHKIVINCLMKHNRVTSTGNPVIGKAALIRHIALGLPKTNGSTVIPCMSLCDIKIHFRKDRKIIWCLWEILGQSDRFWGVEKI